MQPDEGPPQRPDLAEAKRQRALTRNLLIAVGILVGAVCALIVKRQFV